jgi:acyl carrier protein
MKTKDEILNIVQDIFRTNFDDECLIINFETNASEIEAWDSFEQINLILAIEDIFRFKINIEKISKLENVGQIVDVIYNSISE